MNDSTERIGRTVFLVLCLCAPVRLFAQFGEFSSEELRLRAVGLDFGVLGGTNILGTGTVAVRFDIGTVAPRTRVVLGLSYFRSNVSSTALHRFEDRLQSVVIDPSGDDTVNLGEINWGDVTADLDVQYLLPQGHAVLVYSGLGLSVHARNGTGTAIRGTFVEDALDGITAGLNATLGVEIGAKRWRLALEGRGVLASGLSTASISMGVRYRVGVGGKAGVP